MSRPAPSTTAAPPFVTGLRVHPARQLTVSPEGVTPTWTIRVQAAEVHDAIRVSCAPGTKVADIKREAMRVLLPDVSAIDGYLVKFRGAEVRNEALTLEALGAQDASLLFVTSRTRRPIR